MTPFLGRLIDGALSGALILTSNKRLARHLCSAYDDRMLAQGRTVWQAPDIISYDAWLCRCLSRLDEGWRLLDAFASVRLWERLIEEASAGTELQLLQVVSTAKKAQEAHGLLVEYDCSLDGLALTEDQAVFRTWREIYLDVCRQNHWLDRAELPVFVLSALKAGRLPLPDNVLVAGFDQWSPHLDRLSLLVQQSGGVLTEVLSEPVRGGSVLKTPCVDAVQEVETAARWARNLLERGESSIGIVVPDLQTRRSEIERIFRDQIDPSAALKPGDEETAFSLSLGSPLADQGPVHAALELVAAGNRLTLDQASFLLRTPYTGGSQSEADLRAGLEEKLRSFRQGDVGLRTLADRASNAGKGTWTEKVLGTLLNWSRDTASRLPGAWAESFAQQLGDVGWPGERPLSSREYQVVTAWREKLLPTLATLDPVSRPMDRNQALNLLRRLAGEIDFQAEAAPGPVQVVGLLESAGLEFDHLWVMGLSEEAWPAAPRPNPFLPLPMQIQAEMPHSGCERELFFARRVLNRLRGGSDDLVFSYPQRQGDCLLRPSPLIADCSEATPVLAPRHDPLERLLACAPTLEEEADISGPALIAERGEGGTGILKDQALCPFRAFVHFRLQGRAMDEPQPGLDAMTRGNLVHKSLENFWKEIETSTRLVGFSEEELHLSVSNHVRKALEDYFGDRPQPEIQVQEIEVRRLCGLVMEWIETVEKRRPPFRVTETEQEHYEQIGALKIRTVIDRIDQTEDGHRLIIDYKTGMVRTDVLTGERLLEPQLPIYAVGRDEAPADGVAFARVRRGECAMVGVARSSELLPGVPEVGGIKALDEAGIEDWGGLLDHWRRQLEKSADDFVAGRADVDPASEEDACRFCDLARLCRIREGIFFEVTS